VAAQFDVTARKVVVLLGYFSKVGFYKEKFGLCYILFKKKLLVGSGCKFLYCCW
jgi:hypothetical protein